MRGEQFWLDKTRAAQLRPRYTLTPSIVLRGGKPFMALDSPGGDNQHQTILQVCRRFSTSLNSGPTGIRTCTERSNGRASRRCTSTVRSGHTIRVSTSSTSRQTSLTPSTTIYDEGRGQSKEGLSVRHDRCAPRPAKRAAAWTRLRPIFSRALSSQVVPQPGWRWAAREKNSATDGCFRVWRNRRRHWRVAAYPASL
jgi:hypothetical protein